MDVPKIPISTQYKRQNLASYNRDHCRKGPLEKSPFLHKLVPTRGKNKLKLYKY